jgi:CDP-glucose 4,6-dehydratase
MTSSTESLNLRLKLNNINIENYKPYEVSKLSIELITQSYIDCYKLPCIILRPGNIYGGGDFNLNRFIPSMMYNYYIKNIIPSPSRDDISRNFIHTDDLLEFINLIFNDEKIFFTGESFNLFNKDKTKLSYLVNKFRLFIDNQFYVKFYESKTITPKNILNWEPTINIDHGLLKTFNWYKNFYNSKIIN